MRRSTIVNLKHFHMLDLIGKNRILLLMALIFVIGVIIGTVSFGKSSAAQELAKNSLQSYISNRQGSSFGSVFFNSATVSLLFLVAAFLCGASLMGMILVPVLIAYRGFWFGSLSALLYSSYALKGIAFNAIILIPPSLIYLVCLLLAARESLGFSFVIARLTLPKSSPASLYLDFKNYCGRYLFLSVIILISSLIDAVLSCSFLQYFDFQ